jgi:hypothetical protein
VVGVVRTGVSPIAGLLRWAMPWLLLIALSIALARAMDGLVGQAEPLVQDEAVVVDVEATREACAARYGSYNWWILNRDPQSPCVRR